MLNNTSSKPVIVMGAGGHAKVLVDALRLSNREILGFVTPDLEVGENFCGKKVLGNDSEIDNYSPNDIELVNGIGSLPRKNLRWKVAGKMRQKGYYFSSVIHPSAIIATNVRIGKGVQVMAGAIIQADTSVGDDSIVNTGVLLDHDCNIAENCHLAPGVVCSGGVEVGRMSHLGTGTIVIQNISIGENCTLAAGSVVYENVSGSTSFIQTKRVRLTQREDNS